MNETPKAGFNYGTNSPEDMRRSVTGTLLRGLSDQPCGCTFTISWQYESEAAQIPEGFDVETFQNCDSHAVSFVQDLLEQLTLSLPYAQGKEWRVNLIYDALFCDWIWLKDLKKWRIDRRATGKGTPQPPTHDPANFLPGQPENYWYYTTRIWLDTP